MSCSLVIGVPIKMFRNVTEIKIPILLNGFPVYDVTGKQLFKRERNYSFDLSFKGTKLFENVNMNYIYEELNKDDLCLAEDCILGVDMDEDFTLNDFLLAVGKVKKYFSKINIDLDGEEIKFSHYAEQY